MENFSIQKRDDEVASAEHDEVSTKEKSKSKANDVQKKQAEITPTSLTNYFAIPHGRRMPFRSGGAITYYQPVTVMQKIEEEQDEAKDPQE